MHLDIPEGITYSPHALAEEFGSSLGEIADYIQNQEPSLMDRTILGFTALKTSVLMSKYGFPISLNVPQDRAGLVEFLFKSMPETTGRDMGPPVLCAMPARQFVNLPKLARFRGKS